jgi:crotonobetainyl-CoA:carnitine CoA-transferase CaiB-like acyl-CoA transferase
MAAYSILAALREAERSGEGQLVDVSMADGALSWLAMAAAQYLADGRVPGRGAESLTGGFVCYRPYACADGYVTMGALEPKFWAAWCAGVGRDDLMDKAFEPPGSKAHAEVEKVFATRTRAEWKAFADQHDCCLEPVLDLGEALESELVREREMVVELDQPGAQQPVRLLGHPVKFSGTPAHPRRPGPALGEHTAAVLDELGYSPGEIADLEASGAAAGPAEGTRGSFLA